MTANNLVASLPSLAIQYDPADIYITIGQQELVAQTSTVMGVANIVRSIRLVLKKVKELWPNAKVRIATPFIGTGAEWPEQMNLQNNLPLHVAQIGGTGDYGVADILEKWYNDPAGFYSNFQYPVGYHPNEDGHAELAAAFLAS